MWEGRVFIMGHLAIRLELFLRPQTGSNGYFPAISIKLKICSSGIPRGSSPEASAGWSVHM